MLVLPLAAAYPIRRQSAPVTSPVSPRLSRQPLRPYAEAREEVNLLSSWTHVLLGAIMPRNKPRRRSSGSAKASTSKKTPAPERAPEPRFVPPAEFARRLGEDEFSDFLPAAEELERRYLMLGKQLALFGCRFDAECTSSRSSPCWLLEQQGPWNSAINHGGIELRCHRPGRLYFSMVPLSREVTYTIRLMEATSALLAALSLLNNHHCIEKIDIDVDIAFALLARPFFSLLHFRAQVRHLQVIAFLPSGESPSNDELFSLALTNIRSLESFTLRGMVLSEFATRNICEALSWNDSSLTYVSLRQIDLQRSSLEAILTMLHDCRRIRSLDLGLRVGCPGVLQPLADLMESNRDLEEFRYELDGPVRFPFHVLAKNRTLRTLVVGKEIFDEDDIADLANTLHRNRRLRCLGISFCPMEQHLELWSIFTAGISRNTSLRELDMQRSEITDVAAGFLAEALKVNKTLLKLHVATGTLSGNAATCLAESLLTNTTLQELRIGRISKETADLDAIIRDHRLSSRVYRFYIGSQLRTIIELMSLRCQQPELHVLGAEEVRPDFVSDLFFALRVQKHLTKLSIGMNAPLMAHSAKHLAFLFRNSVTLTDVNVCLETKSPEIVILSEGIRQSSSILCLKIEAWLFDMQSTDAFIEMLKHNRSLNYLTIFRANEGTDCVIHRLAEALDENYGLFSIELFEPDNLPIVCCDFLPQLHRKYFRLTKAAAFFKGVLRDPESAEDFRKLAKSEPLLKRLTEDGESSEEEIKTAITEKLAKLRM